MMRDVIKGGLAILATFVVFSALRWISLAVPLAVNVFTVAVILFGLVRGEVAGAVFGMVCGLIIDTFSLGVFGLAGLANTVTGFAAGFISRKLNVLSLRRLFVFMAVLSCCDLGVWIALTALVFDEGLPWGGGLLAVQPLLTAALGTLTFLAYRRIKARHE